MATEPSYFSYLVHPRVLTTEGGAQLDERSSSSLLAAATIAPTFVEPQLIGASLSRDEQNESDAKFEEEMTRRVLAALDKALADGTIFTAGAGSSVPAYRSREAHPTSHSIIRNIEAGLHGGLLQHLRNINTEGLDLHMGDGSATTEDRQSTFLQSSARTRLEGAAQATSAGDDSAYLHAVLSGPLNHPDRAAALAVLKLQAAAAHSAIMAGLLSSDAGGSLAPQSPLSFTLAGSTSPTPNAASRISANNLLLGILNGAAPFSPALVAPSSPNGPPNRRTLLRFGSEASTSSEPTTVGQGGSGRLSDVASEERNREERTNADSRNDSDAVEGEGNDSVKVPGDEFLSSPEFFKTFFQSPKVTILGNQESVPALQGDLPSKSRPIRHQRNTSAVPPLTDAVPKLPNPADITGSFYATREGALAGRHYADALPTDNDTKGWTEPLCVLGSDKVGTTTGQKVFNVLELNEQKDKRNYPKSSVARPLLDFIRAIPNPTDRNLYVLVDPTLPVRPFFDIDMSHWPSASKQSEAGTYTTLPPTALIPSDSNTNVNPIDADVKIINHLLVAPLLSLTTPHSVVEDAGNDSTSETQATAEILAWLTHTVLSSVLRKYFTSNTSSQINVVPTILTSSSTLMGVPDALKSFKLSLHLHYTLSTSANSQNSSHQLYFRNIDEHRLFVLDYLSFALTSEGGATNHSHCFSEVLSTIEKTLGTNENIAAWKADVLQWYRTVSVTSSDEGDHTFSKALSALARLFIDRVVDKSIYTRWRPFRLPYQTKRTAGSTSSNGDGQGISVQSLVVQEQFEANARSYRAQVDARRSVDDETSVSHRSLMIHPALHILASTAQSASSLSPQASGEDSHRFLLPLSSTFSQICFPLLQSVLETSSSEHDEGLKENELDVLLAALIHPFDALMADPTPQHFLATVRTHLLPIVKERYKFLCLELVAAYERKHGSLFGTSLQEQPITLRFKMVMEALHQEGATSLEDLPRVTNIGSNVDRSHTSQPPSFTTAFGQLRKLAMVVDCLLEKEGRSANLRRQNDTERETIRITGSKRLRDLDDFQEEEADEDTDDFDVNLRPRRTEPHFIQPQEMSIDTLLRDKSIFDFKPKATPQQLPTIAEPFNPFALPKSLFATTTSDASTDLLADVGPIQGPTTPLTAARLSSPLVPKPPIPSAARVPISDYHIRNLLAEVFRCLHPQYDSLSSGLSYVSMFGNVEERTPMSLPFPQTHNPNALAGPTALSTCQYEDNGCFRSYYVFQKTNKFCLKLHRSHKNTFGQLFLTYESIKYRCYSNDCFDRCLHVRWCEETDSNGVLQAAEGGISLGPARPNGTYPLYQRLRQLRALLFPQLTKEELAIRYPWLGL